MTDLLTALNWRVGIGTKVRLFVLISLVTLSALVLGVAAPELLGVPVLALQCAIWALWLLWLGVVFPRNRRRDEEISVPYPYRRAFMREILPGIAIAFSQLLRPMLAGIIADEREVPLVLSIFTGMPLLLTGAAIVCLGVAALGVARTLFVYEYVPTEQPVRIVGIFRVLRHPLFLGGSMVSLGLAIWTGSQTALELGVLNACVIPAYVQLEDRRCCAALGRPYVDYRAIVGGVIPRRRSAISLSALEHHRSGIIGPATPRNLVTTR